MRCYCGMYRPGVYDEHGIVHRLTSCRLADHLISPTFTSN